MFLGADGRFYPVGTEAGQLRNPLALAVASTQAKRGEKGIGLIRGIWDKGKPLTT